MGENYKSIDIVIDILMQIFDKINDIFIFSFCWKMRLALFIFFRALYSHHIRHGLVARISGSHPGGPGSIPGVGIIFYFEGSTS